VTFQPCFDLQLLQIKADGNILFLIGIVQDCQQQT
jgi:hypothetical protein